MAHDRPLERKRAARGLGARSAEGETARADPRGRMPEAPGGSLSDKPPREAPTRRRTSRNRNR